MPGPASCLESGALRVYSAPGRCRIETGQCEYAYTESPCALGCYDSSRCRREGDALWETQNLGAWAVEPGGVVAFAGPGETPGCDVLRVRRFPPPYGREGLARETGCADGRNPRSAWPSVTADGGLVLRWSAYSGVTQGLAGVWLFDGDGPHATPPRGTTILGTPPAVALDPTGRVFVATHDEALALESDGGVAWRRTCGRACGSGGARQGLALVLPGRAYVACLTGCASFAPEDGRPLPFVTPGPDVAVALADSRGRVLVGRAAAADPGGLEAFALESPDAGARFAPLAAPGLFTPVAAVVEQDGSVLAAWSARPTPSEAPAYFLSRLAADDLSELARVELPCQPGELAARSDGSSLLSVACPDTHAERGAALWALDDALAVQWKVRTTDRTVGPLAIDALGTIATQFGGTFSARVGAVPPAQSAWPMRGADARNSWSSRAR